MGAPRIVLLSGRGEPEAERAEQAVRDTGAELTVLRATWFMQNFSEDYMLDHVLSGEIRLPGGDVPTPFLDIDDLADVAVAALTDDRHSGRLYELTGPHSLTFADTAAIISAASGRPLRYVPVTLEEHAAELDRARRAGRGGRAAHVPVRRGRRRAQREHHRRGPRRARARAARLRDLRRAGCGGLGRGPRPMSAPLVALTVAAAVGCGVVGGVFFAFSTFVMAALRRLPAPQGIAAMQSINVTAVQPPLMLALFGTAAACAALIVVAVTSWDEPSAPWLLAGGLVYLLGEIVVTIAYNVPLNDELAALDPEADAGRWPGWVAQWSAGNHVRTVAGAASAAALCIALQVA